MIIIIGTQGSAAFTDVEDVVAANEDLSEFATAFPVDHFFGVG
jgi:hypothetical protein